MNTPKINPDYVLPEGLVIGMEGTCFDIENGFPIVGNVRLIGYDTDLNNKFHVKRKDGTSRWCADFTPLQPWQPKPGDRKTGELVWAWSTRKTLNMIPNLYRFAGYNDSIYKIHTRKEDFTFHDYIARYYGESDIGMTIDEIIKSRKLGDILGGGNVNLRTDRRVKAEDIINYIKDEI